MKKTQKAILLSFALVAFSTTLKSSHVASPVSDYSQTVNTIATELLNNLVMEHEAPLPLFLLINVLDAPDQRMHDLAQAFAPEEGLEECIQNIKDAIFRAMLSIAVHQGIPIHTPPPVPPVRS